MMKLLMEEYGQGMAEYGLILAFVFLAVLLSLEFMGGALRDSFENVTLLINGPE